jgi:hypothetical protein
MLIFLAFEHLIIFIRLILSFYSTFFVQMKIFVEQSVAQVVEQNVAQNVVHMIVVEPNGKQSTHSIIHIMIRIKRLSITPK